MARTAPRQPGPPAGVIFGCNRSSEEESLNGLFGMSSGHWNLVKEIIPGTPCFLFNFNTKELHGVFRAVSAGGWNIDPLAYGGKPKEGSMYPAQVRVEYCPRCPPMEEQYFKPAIAANYFNPNRFRWELNERQVEELLDLFLGPGMPWPPRSNTDGRPSRLEYTRGALPFVEDAATRPYTIEPAPRSALDAYRDRDTLYGARHDYRAASPTRGAYGTAYARPVEDETRHRRPTELPPSLQPTRRREEYRRSASPRDRYRDRHSALPEDLRPPPARTDVMEVFRSQTAQDPYRPDLRHSMPMSSSAIGSLYGDTLSIHHAAPASIRGPSLALSPGAVRRVSPPRQHMLLEPVSHRQAAEPQPASPAWDFSSMSHIGDQFTGLASDTAVLDRPASSLPALPADLTLSERFQHLPEHREQHDAAQIGTVPLRVSLSATTGRAVSFPQPDTAAPKSPVAALPASSEPTTLVIGSIPHSCTVNALVSILDQRHKDQYDFLHYQPSDEFDSTAVVNFTRPAYAHQFEEELQDSSWSDLHHFDPPTSAIASVTPHSIQGKAALMAHHSKSATRFGGAPGNESRLPINRPLFFFCAGRKRPAPVDSEQAPAPVRPRMPSVPRQDSYSHPAMQGLPPSTHTGTRGDSSDPRGFDAAVKMEPEAGHAGFAADQCAPLSPNKNPYGESESHMSEHDYAHVRSRPSSAAVTSSRPPGDSLAPLKVTIKQEPGLGQPITPSPDSALDGMGHTLSMLDGPTRGVSSSPRRAAAVPASHQEAAAFLQDLVPQLKQPSRARSPTRRARSPSRHSHRHYSSSRQHGSKTSRPHAEKGTDRHDSKPGSRRTSHAEHKSSRGVQKVSTRDAKPPRDRRSSRDRDAKHRSSKPVAEEAQHATHSKLEYPADLPKASAAKPPAAGRAVHVSVNAAPVHEQRSSEWQGAVANGSAGLPSTSAGRPTEEAVADNTEGLQQSRDFEPAHAVVVTAARVQQPRHPAPPAAMRPADFGADFLAIPSSP